ncbi:hypothetical protein [Actinoplanes sp. NPDC049681]|uniref:hypothetical protein n=1 Tax=Actinoplanes sp. NPDC049681 TaxID=3363905 RepID=UPI00378E846F
MLLPSTLAYGTTSGLLVQCRQQVDPVGGATAAADGLAIQRKNPPSWCLRRLCCGDQPLAERRLHQTRCGTTIKLGPAADLPSRNTAIGYHHIDSATATATAEATRRANHRPHDLIDAVSTGKSTVTRGNPTMQ